MCKKAFWHYDRAYEGRHVPARHGSNAGRSLDTSVTLRCYPSALENWMTKNKMRMFLNSVCVVVCAGGVCGVAQDSSSTAQELARVSRELKETQSQLQSSRQQIEELRNSVDELRKLVEASQAAQKLPSPAPEPSVAAADQDVSFLAAKVAEIHQDKVESASKYPVKVSGLVLFNSYWNSGTLDIQDLPSMAFQKFPGAPPPGIGATLRQTLFGIDVTGPKVLGARTSADAEIDFAGGSPPTAFGVTSGLIRLRTAKVSVDWKRTSLMIGQDIPFFSPLSPTSYATVLEPAMSWSGNLWVWTPQIVAEHRLALNSSSSLVLQGGLLDPLTEEEPVFQGRNPTAGEASRVPAIAGRIAWDRSANARYPFIVGFGGYRAQQQYPNFATIGSWTLNGDFKAGLGSHLEISGEWYTGQATGGLGGGIWSSVIYDDPSAPSAIHALRSTGGWAQLKVTPSVHFEMNAAIGQDENFGHDLRVFPVPFSAFGFPALQKNHTDLLNFIYKPNAVLLFAVEYRHLFTAPPVGAAASGDHVNVAAGVHF